MDSPRHAGQKDRSFRWQRLDGRANIAAVRLTFASIGGGDGSGLYSAWTPLANFGAGAEGSAAGAEMSAAFRQPEALHLPSVGHRRTFALAMQLLASVCAKATRG